MKRLSLQTTQYQYIEKSFGEWLDIQGYAPQTVYQLPNYAREFFHRLEQQKIELHELEAIHFKKHYEYLQLRRNECDGGGLSVRGLNKHVQALHKLADYLRQSGRVDVGAFYLSRHKLHTDQIEILTKEEVAALYMSSCTDDVTHERFSLRDRAILTVYYGCGLRRNEGYHLNLSDIDLDRGTLKVRKGKNYRQRLVPFTKTGGKHLERYIYDSRPHFLKERPTDAFFVSQRGTRMDTQTMALRLRMLQKQSELISLQQKNVRLHVLRHSIATHLLASGMELEKIARFLGHSSLESTQIYTHLTLEG